MSDSANLTPDNDATAEGVGLLAKFKRLCGDYDVLNHAENLTDWRVAAKDLGIFCAANRVALGKAIVALREKAARDAAPADPCWCGVARDGHSAKQQRICDSERPPVAAPADVEKGGTV